MDQKIELDATISQIAFVHNELLTEAGLPITTFISPSQSGKRDISYVLKQPLPGLPTPTIWLDSKGQSVTYGPFCRIYSSSDSKTLLISVQYDEKWQEVPLPMESMYPMGGKRKKREYNFSKSKSILASQKLGKLLHLSPQRAIAVIDERRFGMALLTN